MQRFNLKTLNDAEVKEQYQVKISTTFPNLENFDDDDDDVDINRAWKSIRENMKVLVTGSLGYYEFKRHKAWFKEECSKFLD
jgi:hypothetical protein